MNINILILMTNAFVCTRHAAREATINEVIRECDRPLFLQRVLNGVVQFQLDYGTLGVIPGGGNLMGSKEAPKMFLRSFQRDVVEPWLEATGHLGNGLRLTSVDGTLHRGDVVEFADDLFRKYVEVGGVSAVRCLQYGDEKLDKILEENGWRRNVAKRVLVAGSRRRGDHQSLKQAAAGGELELHARHLGTILLERNGPCGSREEAPCN